MSYRFDPYDFTIYAGDTIDAIPLRILKNGVPLVLTGATISMDIRRSDTGAKMDSLAVGSGLSIVNELDGSLQIDQRIYPLEAGTYFYDVEFVIAGVKKTYVKGTITVIGDVTHA